jgi:hypothetical protein
MLRADVRYCSVLCRVSKSSVSVSFVTSRLVEDLCALYGPNGQLIGGAFYCQSNRLGAHVSDRKDEEDQYLSASRGCTHLGGRWIKAKPIQLSGRDPVVRKQPLTQDGVEVSLGSAVVDEAQLQDAGPVLLVPSFNFCI